MTTERFSGEKTLDVLGIGHAIVDVLKETDEITRARLGMTKGKMTLLSDSTESDRIISAFGGVGACALVPGGSAANTVNAMAAAGAGAGFIGKVGGDPQGEAFASGLAREGVLFYGGAPGRLPTGVCCIAVTPDGERSMATYLGASRELRAEEAEPEMLASAKILYAETYLWDDAQLQGCIRACFAGAHKSGGETALSLSDPFCVDRHARSLQHLIDSRAADLVFGNKEETAALYPGLEESVMPAFFAARTKLFCRTLGAEGAVIYAGGEAFRIPALPETHVRDATGAGDLFAAGALLGRLRGLSPADCGRLGCRAASYILERLGGRVGQDFSGLMN